MANDVESPILRLRDAPIHAHRRRFLAGIGATAGALAAGGNPLAAKDPKLPDPDDSGIEHIVVLMMENRSFDHFLGWMPKVDGEQAGLKYIDRNGIEQRTYPLAPDFQGCRHSDPDHSYAGGRVEYNKGACDGWLRAGANDLFSIGYYTQNDLAFLGRAAPQWTVLDRYFAAIMAETYPNRIYQHAAQTDRLDNTTEVSTLPTIWDRLAAKGVSGRYYFSDVPFLALWGAKYLTISRPFGQFLFDCATGNLPQVSFVDPRFLGEESGLSGDDHPHSDIRNGEAFLDLVYKAVTLSKSWSNTLLVINYDEWGGFFDHVPPPKAPVPDADRVLGNDGRLGFRVPSLLVSPFAQRGAVSSTTFDHTSILKMIEWRWDLKALTVRDQTAANLAEALDFKQKKAPAAPQFAVPLGPFGGTCAAPSISTATTTTANNVETNEWLGLRETARRYGWPI